MRVLLMRAQCLLCHCLEVNTTNAFDNFSLLVSEKLKVPVIRRGWCVSAWLHSLNQWGCLEKKTNLVRKNTEGLCLSPCD